MIMVSKGAHELSKIDELRGAEYSRPACNCLVIIYLCVAVLKYSFWFYIQEEMA